jgi:hypothetical protein
MGACPLPLGTEVCEAIDGTGKRMGAGRVGAFLLAASEINQLKR